MENHYPYLEREFMPFYLRVCAMENVAVNTYINNGMIVAHGDKCYQSDELWDDHGVPFERGAAIYLLTYINALGK